MKTGFTTTVVEVKTTRHIRVELTKDDIIQMIADRFDRSVPLHETKLFVETGATRHGIDEDSPLVAEWDETTVTKDEEQSRWNTARTPRSGRPRRTASS